MTGLAAQGLEGTPRLPVTPRRNSIFTSIDLDRPGKQIGYFCIPQSPHDDAWGVVQVPLAVVKHGSGPTVLIEAVKAAYRAPPRTEPPSLPRGPTS